jgi:K+-sensing histidine kinase KdpD
MWAFPREPWLPIALAFALTAAITGALELAVSAFISHHLIWVYLIPVGLIGLFYGSGTAVTAGLMSGLASAFFLYPPQFSLLFTDYTQAAEVVFFTILAVTAGVSMSKLSPIRNVSSVPEHAKLTALRGSKHRWIRPLA